MYMLAIYSLCCKLQKESNVKKSVKSLMLAVLFAGAGLVSQVALAAGVDISHPPAALEIVDGTTDFGAAFGNLNQGNFFSEKFSFTITGANSIDAYLSSISSRINNGLDITGFDLRDGNGLIVVHGLQGSTGTTDLWSVNADSIAAGAYFLQVQGSVVSNTSGSFGGNVNITPVPEPETYAMMLAGLGLLGFLVRRRKVVR
jgi:hypothetical protein